MIEFRLHEGRVQYRMWEVWIDDETNEMTARKKYRPETEKRVAGWDVEWTEWLDVPVAPSRADYISQQFNRNQYGIP